MVEGLIACNFDRFYGGWKTHPGMAQAFWGVSIGPIFFQINSNVQG